MSDLVRQHLAWYARPYLNSEFKLAESGHIGYDFFPLIFSFNYENLHHAPIKIDVSQMAVNFTKYENEYKEYENVVYINLPLIKDWTYMCNYHARFGFLKLIPMSGMLAVNVSQATAYTALKMRTDDTGILHPIIEELHVDFGESELHMSGLIRQFIFRQSFHFVKYVMMDAINRFGPKMYSHVFPNYFAKVTHGHHKSFNMTLPQLDKFGRFNIDYRLTKNPVVQEGNMDIDFFFDIGEGYNHCTLPHDEIQYKFENFGADYLQVVLSERVPNCLLQAMEKQDFFKFEAINSEWMRQKFGTTRFNINSERFMDAFPDLATRYGAGTEFDFEISMIEPRVTFGPSSGENVRFACTIEYGLKELGSLNYIIFD